MFRPGDRIICVDDSFDDDSAHRYSALPTKGPIYVVRESSMGVHLGNQVPAVWLVGIDGDWNHFLEREWGFLASRFRKTSELSKEERMELVQPQPVNA